MTTDSAPRIKITYATLRADNEELHAGFEAAVAEARRELGGHHKNYVDGVARWRRHVRGPFADRSRARARHVRQGHTEDVDAAVAAARAAQPGWAAVPWRERLAIVRRAADTSATA